MVWGILTRPTSDVSLCPAAVSPYPPLSLLACCHLSLPAAISPCPPPSLLARRHLSLPAAISSVGQDLLAVVKSHNIIILGPDLQLKSQVELSQAKSRWIGFNSLFFRKKAESKLRLLSRVELSQAGGITNDGWGTWDTMGGVHGTQWAGHMGWNGQGMRDNPATCLLDSA